MHKTDNKEADRRIAISKFYRVYRQAQRVSNLRMHSRFIICVFNRPDDYPDKCVARLFEGTAPTNIIITRNTVEEIREDITKRFPAMLPFGRNREDHKSVVESWI